MNEDRPPRTRRRWGVAALALSVAGAGLVFFVARDADTVVLARQTEPVAVFGWGTDTYGQLRHGSNSVVETPVPVLLPTGTTDVDLGQDFAVALVGDAVYTWGHDEVGQLGNGAGVPRKDPAPLDLANIVDVVTGARFALALDERGRVYAWGDDADGQLGDGSDEGERGPRLVDLPGPVIAMAAGSRHALALTADGEVFAWGSGTDGELGTGEATSSPRPVRVSLPDGMRASQLAAGDRHSLAVTDDGQLLAWGSNYHGRLGLGQDSVALLPSLVPSAGDQVVQVDTGLFASGVLTTDGEILMAGRNDAGQLGDGTTTDRDAFVRTALPAGFQAGFFSAGSAHGAAVSRDGTDVVAWGESSGGLLGTGDREDGLTPVRLELGGSDDDDPKVFTAVVSGYSASLLMARQGAVESLVVNIGSVPVTGERFDVQVVGLDSSGNHLGTPTDTVVDPSVGSCEGLVCTVDESGPVLLAVTAGSSRVELSVEVFDEGDLPGPVAPTDLYDEE